MKNGKDIVEIQTVNGNFSFRLQRFCTRERNAAPSILARKQGEATHNYRTKELEQKACNYATKMPYEITAQVLEDISGGHSMSGQEIENVVKRHAAQVSRQESNQLTRIIETSKPIIINTKPDIYNKLAPEILTIADGIVVKKQKEVRDGVPSQNKRFVSTTIVGVQLKDGTMKNIIESYDGENELSLDKKLIAVLQQNYTEIPNGGLPVVAINDGAQNLRNMYLLAFGLVPCIILDWYHLCKKVRSHISMSGLEKTAKQELTKKIIILLWNGKHNQVIDLLNTTESTQGNWKTDLMAYITKHHNEIINYKQRKEAGKKIGSGYIESAVNGIVGRRQKSKGMSWSTNGCHALAILRNQFADKPQVLKPVA